MSNQQRRKWQILMVIISIFLLRCVQPAPQSEFWKPIEDNNAPISSKDALKGSPTPSLSFTLPPTRIPGAPIFTPTPDPPRVLPTLRSEQEEYVLQPGDTLGKVAQMFNVDIQTLVEANQIVNPNLVPAGLRVIIPAPSPQPPGPPFKIIPDSELVFSPAAIPFDVFAFVRQKGGYLFAYRETLDDQPYTGSEVVIRVAREYSVNPRLLLAVLEYQSGWVTQTQPPANTMDFPLRFYDPNRRGLYSQLSWAANQLNRGYYLWKVNGISHWPLSDGGLVPADPTINAATAGVQHLMSLLYSRSEWDAAVGPEGVFAVYTRFFGYPFDFGIEPLLPPDLQQPVMQLPFEEGVVWSFTGGPHGGWGDGSAWAALDFAPPDSGWGCGMSNQWVTAVADGLVVRSETGLVVLDLDGDGYEQTGWTVLYLHLATADRASVGMRLKAGDRVGHPSCEGGVSNGTHVHIARKFNGEWIPADGAIPFVLDGWVSVGDGVEYNGMLVRNGVVVEAWDRLLPENQISR